MIKLDAVINDKKLLSSIQKGVDIFNKSTSGKSKLNLKINEKGFRQPLGRITGDLDKFESALAASNARVIAFGASTAVIGGMTKAFKELALTTINVQKSFADINRILNVSNREFESFSTQLFNIGKRTATTFEDSSKAALEFARQGLGLTETLKRTADALTLVRLTGVNADKAVSSLTAAVNAFQHTSITTTEVLNKFVAVETKFAVSARDLMEGLGRVGSAAVDAKVNFNELNAMVAAVQQQTGRGGAVIGNALKTIFTRLQRRDTLTALESYGIAVRNIEGQTRPAMAILQDFAKTYDKLADSNKAYLREQVAGVFQANILSAIVKDLNSNTQVYNRAMVVSTNATNESEMANARLNKTLSALISQTGTELIRLQENLGKITFEPIAKGLLAPFKGVVEGLNNLIDGEGLGSEIANGLLKGIRNVLAGPGLIGAFAVIGSTIIKTVGYMAKALPTLVGITSQTQKRANLEATISAMLATDAGLVRQIAASEGNAATQAGILLAASQKTETAFAAAAISTAAIARNLAKAGMVASKAGAIVPRGRGATGFIPGMAGELSDIRRGTGGVSSSARPVHLPNFAFAGGDRGSMIANTGEYTVPNYRGGGSAIFNPDMVRANGGLPKGAKKITASKGYVPNFAIKPTTALGAGTTLDALTRGIISGQYSAINVGRSYDVGGKTYSAATINEKILAARVSRDAKVKGKKDKKGAKNVFSIPAGELAGGIGAIVGFATRSPALAATSQTGFAQLIAGKKSPNPQLAAYLQKNATGKNAKHIQLTGIPVAALNSLGGTGDAKAKKSIETRFRKKLNKFMLPALNRYTSTIFKDLLKDDGLTFVKELLENSLDAGSTRIRIETTEGGIESISVIDNGGGIPEVDVPLVFKRFA
ncbi:MAG TPA: phage tail tape measure protein, partial [Flavobacteriales bacterium]|nr:phage tail tape measure protein [Flavobacteriales bacterium]